MIQSTLDVGVRLLTLDRPDSLNAFNTDQFERLAELMVQAQDESGTKVVVLTGAGRAFSAGADLHENRPPADQLKYGFEGFIDIVIDFPKPFVLAINGIGVGVGATLCGLADMVFIAQNARLRCPFSALGLTAEACSTYTFPRLMGPQAAAQFLMGAHWMDATECKVRGLVTEVLPEEGFLTSVVAQAKTLAKLPMSSLLQTKALLLDAHRDALKAANKRENEALRRLRNGPAHTEAVAAFRDKREPDFSGL